MKRLYSIIFIISSALLLTACEDTLQEDVYSELSPESILESQGGRQSLLNSAYGNIQYRDTWFVHLGEFPSGGVWSRGGSIETMLTPLTNFTWDSNLQYFGNAWSKGFAAVRDANILLDNITADTEENKKTIAEAKFIRGVSYYTLYDFFGPLPLYTSSTSTDFNLPRKTAEETAAFIESQFQEALNDLPVTADQSGRATKGAALGYLAKLYLKTGQWQKCADKTSEIIALNKYALLENYNDVFDIGNEGNNELIWVIPATGQAGTTLVALTYPTDYPVPYPNNQLFAARTYLFDDFVNSFEAGDTRKNLIETSYKNTAGKVTQLLGINQSFPGKYGFDPNSVGASQGNDVPVIRYADILLTRAEALNEINGPNIESINLINEIRTRAKTGRISLADFSGKESLRTRIFKERQWELWWEGKRREDQIRQGTYISGAVARGKNAKDFHVLYPLPLTELTANPNLAQNNGY